MRSSGEIQHAAAGPDDTERAGVHGMCSGDGAADGTAFRRCTSRLPTESEKRVLADLLRLEKERFAGDEAAARVAMGETGAQGELLPGASPEAAAAWMAVCRVLLNLDETISRE
jgi:hypothetical protein